MKINYVCSVASLFALLSMSGCSVAGAVMENILSKKQKKDLR